MRAVLNNSQRMHKLKTVEEIFTHVMEEAHLLVGSDQAILYLKEESEPQKLQSRIGDDGSHVSVTIGTGIVGACALSCQPINVPNAHEDPRFDARRDLRFLRLRNADERSSEDAK